MSNYTASKYLVRFVGFVAGTIVGFLLFFPLWILGITVLWALRKWGLV